jgi:signal transduction histidine kinase/pSer/pThr/pTyr-binding forkhead associated (FHA) protein
MDISLADPGISACHACVFWSGGGWVVEDEASTNGTLVNGQQRKRAELHDGDHLRLGSVTLTFSAATPTGTTTALWHKGTSPTPVPPNADRAPVPADGQGRLNSLLCNQTSYSRLRALDTAQVPSRAGMRIDADPTQLARHLRASYEISRATAATLDSSEILDRVLAALFEIFTQADRAFIVLTDPDTQDMHTAAVRERSPGTQAPQPISETAIRLAMDSREALLCRDAADDDRFAEAQSIMTLGIRSMMIAPLIFREQVLGAVHIDSITGIREFTDADLELLVIAASQVAGCLANARLHADLLASERLAAVGQTVAGLSHCVKNILQGMKGGGFILAKGIEKENLDRVRSGWDMLERNTAFMEDLVYDLLTYSKPRTPEYTPANLNELCQDIADLLAERAREHEVTLTTKLDPNLGPVELDPQGIRRCVLNLATNAIDACAETAGTVTIQTHAPDATDGPVRILIRDSGCGMSEDALAKLFTVFFSTKGSKGTGLGLPVTQKIIEEHGGDIHVDSREGQGTTFTLSLPSQRPPDSPKGEPRGHPARQESPHRR